MADNPFPIHGARIRCINNTDRPELVVGQVYTVVNNPDLDRTPTMINPGRWYPNDYRWVSIKLPGQKDNGIYPFGCFEEVK
jgi:hypothetical protein